MTTLKDSLFRWIFAIALASLTLSTANATGAANLGEIDSKNKSYIDLAEAENLAEKALDYLDSEKPRLALPLLLKALDIFENEFGSEALVVADTLERLAIVNYQLSKYDDALSLQLRALKIRKKLLSADHKDIAIALNNVGRIYTDLARYQDAVSFLEQALSIQEKSLGSEHPDIAPVLANLGWTYYVLGKYQDALPLQERLILILDKNEGSESEDTSTALSELGLTYLKLARFEEALSAQLRALEIAEKVLGAEHPGTATVLNNLGLAYDELGRHEKALPIRLRALAIREKTLVQEHVQTANSLVNLASTQSALGNYHEALSLEIRALAIREKHSGADHPQTARALSNLAITYLNLAQYDTAIVFMSRALSIRERVFGANHPDVAVSLGGLASMYSELGQYEKALSFELRAYSIRAESLGPDHPDTVIALSNIAWLHHNLEQYEKVLPLRIQVLSNWERILGAEHALTAVGLGNLGRTYADLGQYEKALPYQLQALTVRQKVLGDEHPDTATALSDIGETYSKLGQTDNAAELEIQALAIFEKNLGLDHPRTAFARLRVGFRLAEDQSSDYGLALLKSAVNSLQSQRQMVSRIGDVESLSYTSSLLSTYQDVADVFISRGRISEGQYILEMLKQEEQFEYIRRSGGSDVKNLRIGFNSNEISWVHRYAEMAARLQKLSVEARELKSIKQPDLTVDQKKRQDQISQEIVAAQSQFLKYLKNGKKDLSKQAQSRKVEIDKVSIEALRETQQLITELGKDVALLQYYITEKRVGILLTTSVIQLARTRDMDTRELNKAISNFRRVLQDPTASPYESARYLYDILIAPIERDLEDSGVKTVMLSLDGALRYLPFSALHDGRNFLLHRWRLPVYTSVTRSKLTDDISANWTAAAMGVSRAWPEFEALTGVKREVETIVKTASGGVIPGKIYLDEAFTAEQLKSVSQRDFSVVHIASHFRFSPGTEVNSFLLLGDGRRLTIGDIRSRNYRFHNVDLLTLSACDTGLGGGRDERGREIEGFGVVAQQQGAKSVLATLWKVSDRSTSTLMADLYSRRQARGLTKIEALRQAQIGLQKTKRYSHPFYWAPFILMGNWR